MALEIEGILIQKGQVCNGVVMLPLDELKAVLREAMAEAKRKSYERGKQSMVYLERDQLCDLFGVSRQTLSKWRKYGHHKLGRLPFLPCHKIKMSKGDAETIREQLGKG